MRSEQRTVQRLQMEKSMLEADVTRLQDLVSEFADRLTAASLELLARGARIEELERDQASGVRVGCVRCVRRHRRTVD